MDIPDFTDTDLARLALSLQLQQLAEEFRQAVAADDSHLATASENGHRETAGSDPAASDLAARLWVLLASKIPVLRAALVRYAHCHGRAWHEIAALTDLTEGQARELEACHGYPHLPDPAAAAAALDAWYIRHAQLEPLARVANPFSRLLSSRTASGSVCLICAKYEGQAVPAWAGYPIPPGGHLIDDGTWLVGHGPTPYWPAGTLLIESRRHFLDYADFNAEEAASLGPLIRRLTNPLKEVTGASRIHVFSSMEGTSHFHLWMVPRTGDVQSGRTYIADPGYCTHQEAENVARRVRKAIQRERQSP